jgi:hypothetical protein
MQFLHNCKIVVDSVNNSLTIATLANEKPVSTNLKANHE